MGLVTKVSKAQSLISILQSCLSGCSENSSRRKLVQGEEVCPPSRYRCLGALGARPRALGSQWGSACPLGSSLLLSRGESGPAVCAGAHMDMACGGEKGSGQGAGSPALQMLPGAWGARRGRSGVRAARPAQSLGVRATSRGCWTVWPDPSPFGPPARGRCWRASRGHQSGEAETPAFPKAGAIILVFLWPPDQSCGQLPGSWKHLDPCYLDRDLVVGSLTFLDLRCKTPGASPTHEKSWDQSPTQDLSLLSKEGRGSQGGKTLVLSHSHPGR